MMNQEIEKLIEEFGDRPAAGTSRASEVMEGLVQGIKPLRGERAVTGSSLAHLIDHTALKPETSVDDVAALCQEAVTYGFASVCVNPCYVPLAAALLAESSVSVCTVIGFPLGASTPAMKEREAVAAVADGALEVDMVINVGMLKSGEHDYVEADIRSVADAVGKRIVTKVILETALLTDDEKTIACLLARSAGADFVKTSTGFSSGGARLEDVALMRKVVGDKVGVKASGGIRTTAQARAMIEAGATRLGASSSVAIVRGEDSGSSEY